MALSKSEVIIIDATVLTGLLVLLTLTNIGKAPTGVASEQLMQGAINFLTIMAILPFAISALLESYHAFKIRRLELEKRLKLKLEDAKKANNAELITKIEKAIKKNQRGLKRFRKLSIVEEVIPEDEATVGGLGSMFAGFIYIILVLGFIYSIIYFSTFKFFSF